MAARQVRRLLKMASLPLAGSAGLALGVPVVKAEAVQNPGEPRRTISPKDLPIYDEPTDIADYRVIPVDTSGYVYQAVSFTRRNLWKFSDSIQGAVEKVKSAYKFAEKTEKDVVDYIKTEEGLYPRAGAIALAGLTGVLLARKGGVFRKVVYSGTLMAATASVCYPYQVVRITKAEYETIQTFWRDSAGSGVADRVKDRMNIQKKQHPEAKSSSAPDDTTSEIAPSDETAPSTESNNLSTDHGMSNPEDKDMYTTRT